MDGTTHRGNGNPRNGAGGFLFLYTLFDWGGRVWTDLEDVQYSCLVWGYDLMRYTCS